MTGREETQRRSPWLTKYRELTADELKHVGGGFEAVEHSLTILQATSQQMTYMMQVVDSVIRDI